TPWSVPTQILPSEPWNNAQIAWSGSPGALEIQPSILAWTAVLDNQHNPLRVPAHSIPVRSSSRDSTLSDSRPSLTVYRSTRPLRQRLYKPLRAAIHNA